jgi:imidazolonepropionase-like amidohydrolase
MPESRLLEAPLLSVWEVVDLSASGDFHRVVSVGKEHIRSSLLRTKLYRPPVAPDIEVREQLLARLALDHAIAQQSASPSREDEMKRLVLAILTIGALLVVPGAMVLAQEAVDIPEGVTLFKNVGVFNGTEDKLHDVDVLVVKNRIHKVAEDIPTRGTWEVDITTGGVKQIKDPAGGMHGYTFTTFSERKKETKQVKVNVIDGGGRTLMPGLIDSHVHINMYKNGTLPEFQNTTWEEIGARAAAFAQEMLAQGFTTMRDMCGAHEGLKKVIDAGLLPGPRLYLSGACISQISGHGDWGIAGQRKGESNLERLELTRLADGRDEVLAAGRRNFALGAHYLKVMVSGGVTSVKDPIYGSQYSDDEISAAVETAEDWGSYVAVHVFQDEDLGRVLDLGVKVIDHGMTISEENMKNLVEKGAFFSPNLTALAPEALLHPMHQDPTFPPTQKFMWLRNNSDKVYDLIREYKPKMVFNSDYVLLTGAAYRSSMDFTKFNYGREFGNFWALQMMTKNGGELAALTGPENPYPDGKLGVIEEGAYADILVVDGNPLEDITVIGGNEKWFDAEPRGPDIPTIRVIMKDGKIYKNTLDQPGPSPG